MRKAQASVIDFLGKAALAIIVAGITLAVGANIVTNAQTTVGGNSTVGYQTVQWLALNNGTLGIANLSVQFPLIATVLALVCVIGAVMLLRGRQ